MNTGAEPARTPVVTARAYLAQARHLREAGKHPAFYWTLLRWAAKARQRAVAPRLAPAQGDLFGSAA